MSTSPQPARDGFAHRLRRWVVGAIIASFSIAALGGIVVLLSGTWSDTAGKVLGTTALTGLFSVAVLCGVALLGKALQWFAWVTIVISITTLVVLLSQLWNDFAGGEYIFKFNVTLCVLTAACAVASLLLLLIANDRQSVRLLLWVTISLIGVGVILSLLPVWQEEIGDQESYWRIIGVVWILAALGTVVLPVMSLLLRRTAQTDQQQIDQQQGVQQQGVQQHSPSFALATLSPASVERIEAVAKAQGVTADELIERLLP